MMVSALASMGRARLISRGSQGGCAARRPSAGRSAGLLVLVPLVAVLGCQNLLGIDPATLGDPDGGSAGSVAGAGGTGGAGGGGGMGGSGACLPRAFVTATLTSGSFNGIAGANAACAAEATSANLCGTYVAFIATTAYNPLDEIGRGPWYLPGGDIIVADTPSELLDRLQAPIDHHAAGVRYVGTNRAWTGLFDNGMPASANCSDWTTNESASGRFGRIDDIDPSWFGANTQGCMLDARLYCFQQTLP